VWCVGAPAAAQRRPGGGPSPVSFVSIAGTETGPNRDHERAPRDESPRQMRLTQIRLPRDRV